MKNEKRAWIYCRIDAPEDTHGALKDQRKQLMDYAEQMEFIVAGCSEDTGNRDQLGWPGLKLAIQAAKQQRIQALLLAELPRFGTAQWAALPLLKSAVQNGIAVYSPMEGKINFQ